MDHDTSTDLILWRHAQAVDATTDIEDLKRPLTQQGEEQAREMAGWLKRHLPPDVRILVSPALRTRQTVLRLTKNRYTIEPALAPDTSVQALLKACHWPQGGKPVLVVGHQPTLGMVVQQLLGMHMPCAIKKGAVWWLQHRVREGESQIILKAVQNPRML